jgi:tRNA (adenine-N(1)-)-methyltransferase non-catalytic subunit
MLNLVNVHPGGRYLAVDEVSGLLVAGVLEKLGGVWYYRQ